MKNKKEEINCGCGPECECGCQEGKPCTCNEKTEGMAGDKVKESLNSREAEYLDMLKRLAAEFENYKRRTADGISKATNDGIVIAVERILPCLDAFEKAQTIVVDENSRRGIELIRGEFERAIFSLGVMPIEALNKPFDPAFHNAIVAEHTEGVEPGIVTQEFQKGYQTKDKIIRYSVVKVSK